MALCIVSVAKGFKVYNNLRQADMYNKWYDTKNITQIDTSVCSYHRQGPMSVQNRQATVQTCGDLVTFHGCVLLKTSK